MTLSLRGEIANLAARLFPDAKVQSAGSSSEAIVTATYVDGLLRYALSLSPDCTVLAPPDAVERWKQMAARILQAHRSRRTSLGASA